MLTEMAVLLDGAADYIDDATIAHTDADEAITGSWTYQSPITIDSGDSRKLLLKDDANGDAANSYIEFQSDDATVLGWIGYGSAGHSNFTIYQATGDPISLLGNVEIDPDTVGPFLDLGDGAGGDGDTLLRFNTDRPWAFRQSGTGAGTSLELRTSNDNKTFNIADSSGTVFASFHGSTSAGSSYFFVQDGAYQRWYDSTNTKFIQLQHNGTNGTIDVSGGSLVFDDLVYFNNGSNAITMSSAAPKIKWVETDAAANAGTWDIVTAAGQLRFRTLNDTESSQSNWMTVTRSGQNAQTIALIPYGNMQFSSTTGHVQLLNGMDLLVYDGSSTDYLRLDDDGTYSYLYSNNNPIKYRSKSSGACEFSSDINSSIADDGIHEFTHNGTGYGMWFVMNNYNNTTVAIIACAGTATSTIYAGSLVSVGASGTNPDVDGRANYWCDSAGNLHVKNRLGSARRFSAYNFSG